MTERPTRHIHKSSWRCSEDVKELLQAVFIGEITAPSQCLWLVSPWISDIPIIDNKTGSFDTLDSSWGPRVIRLIEVLGQGLRNGSTLVVATRPVAHNIPFVHQLRRAAELAGAVSALHVHESEDLHEKGLLGDDYYLSGSMNFTFGGVELLEETVKFDTAPEVIAQARLVFHDRWGGVLPAMPS